MKKQDKKEKVTSPKSISAAKKKLKSVDVQLKDPKEIETEKQKKTAHLKIKSVPIQEGDKVSETRRVKRGITERKRVEKELFIANKELAFQNEEKERRAAELIIANKELTFQNVEKEKRAAELIIANKELVFQNEEKEKRAAELIIANKELAFQNEEKEKRAAELIIANKELEDRVIKQTAELRESEKKFRTVVEEAVEIIFVVDNHGYFTYVNPAGLRLSGYSLDELKQLKYTDLIEPEFKQRVKRNYLRQYLERQGVSTIEYPYRTKSGEIKWFNQNGRLIIENDEVKRFYFIARDVTERRRAEDALKESNERFNLVIKELNDVVWTTSLDGSHFFDVSNTFEKFYGISTEKFKANPKLWIEMVHPDDRQIAEESGKKLFEDGKATAEYRIVRPDGSIVWILDRKSLIYDENGKAIQMGGVARDITDRKRAEEKLRESEEHFRALIEHSHDTITLLAADGNVLYDSPSIVHLLGYSPLERIGRKVFEFVYPEERQRMAHGFAEFAKQTGAVAPTEVRLIHKDGTPRWIEGVRTNLLHEPAIEAVVVNYRDITERKRAEKALWESEEKYKTIAQSTVDVIFTLDKSGKLLFSNESVERVLGYKVEEVIGKSFTKFVQKKELVKFFMQMKNVFQHKEVSNFVTQIFHKDGHLIDVEINGKLITKKGKYVAQGSIRDITERKRAEDALLKLKKAVDNSGEVIFLTDKEGLFTFVNPAFTSIYGFTTDEIVGKATPRILKSGVKDANYYKLFWENLKSGKEKRGELINKRKDGTLINVEISASPIFDEKNNIIGFLGIQRDITARKRMESELRESEAELKEAQRVGRLGSWDWDTATDTITWSEEYYRIYGFDPKISPPGYEEHLNIYTPESAALLDEAVKKSMQTGEEYQLDLEIARVDGTTRWVSTHGEVKHDDKCQIVGLRGTAHDITERKRAEEELLASEARYRSYIDATGQIGWVTNADGGVVEDVPSLRKFSGQTYEEAKGSGWAQALHPDDLERTLPVWNKAVNTKSSYEIEYRMRRHDGVYRYLLARGFPVFKEDGNIREWVGTCIDITERKRTEEEIVMLAHSLRSINECVSITDLEDNIQFVNESFLKTYGYDENELVGKHITIVGSLNNPPELVKEISPATKSGGWKGELWNKRKDGSEFPIYLSTTIIHDKDGKPLGLIGVAKDITERKHAEVEIIYQKNRFAQLFENSPIAIALLDDQDKVVFINESFSALFGYYIEEVKGKSIDELIVPPEFAEEAKSYSAQNLAGDQINKEGVRKKKDGSYVSAQIIGVPITIDDRTIGSYGIYVDLTQRKKAEEELIIANKELVFQNQEKEKRSIELIVAKEKAEQSDKLKDAFINNMSHEIRTPLNGIMGLSSIIHEMYAQYVKAEDEDLFTGINHSAERILRTVDMILNYSRLITGDFKIIPKEISLLEICKHVINRNKDAVEKKNLELIFDNRCDDAKITGDEYTITQIVSNLVDNAMKYTKEGTIEIVLSPGTVGGITMEIKDTGIGIAEEYLEHLFEPYRQEEMGYGRPYEGLGLGLALTKKYVELNNAVLSVESKKNEGTTFMVTLIKAMNQKKETAEPEKIITKIEPADGTQNRLVLIVEDDFINQMTIKRFLGSRYSTLITDSYDEVIDILKKNKVDLILMDISIQGGKNGLELTTELKATKEYSQIPVIAVTAHAFNEDRQNALAAGCDDYLAKPFTTNQLFEKIGKFVKYEVGR